MEATALQATTIYRKTARGVSEIETRALKLAPRPRSVLVMVDGRRNGADLRRQLGDRSDEMLEQLLREGFIEPVPASAGAASPPAAPAVAAAATAAAASSPPAQPPPSDLPAIRRAAVRQLLDQVGPHGEGLAMKIESARSWAELKPLLVIGQQMLANLRGDEAAEAWRKRLLPS